MGKTAVDIPEFHGMQSGFDTAIGAQQRRNRTNEQYGFDAGGEDVYENTPEESSADVRASPSRDERRADRASRGGYAKQMQQQFLQDAEDRQRNIKRTEIDIPREGAIQDVFENAPAESEADIRSGQEIHEVIQTKGLAKTMAMRATQAAEEAQSVKTSSQRLPAPKKFVEYENVGVKAKSHQEYCGICRDPVYRNDRLDLGKFVLHEQCFRCLKCGLKLTNSNFATYGDVVLCKAHYHQLFQVKGNYTELARQTERYSISGSTERLIQAGEITEEEAKQMMIIQAEVDTMVEERRTSTVKTTRTTPMVKITKMTKSCKRHNEPPRNTTRRGRRLIRRRIRIPMEEIIVTTPNTMMRRRMRRSHSSSSNSSRVTPTDSKASKMTTMMNTKTSLIDISERMLAKTKR